MLFSSITFLYYFLPCVLLLYAIAPKSLKNLILLVSSLIFYAWGEPKYIFLMLGSIFSAFIFGILIDKFRETNFSKVCFIASVVCSIGSLGFFKYADFFIENVNAIFSSNLALLNIALPIGISFYTFQILSYTIDLYKGKVAVQKNFLDFATYVALFPQLIAGPIVRYADVQEQLASRKHSVDDVAYGVQRFVLGLAKKVLIANQIGQLSNILHASDDKSILTYWLYAICVMLHIYFDFSGYSDMAIGLGRIFGFRFLENFNYPFISTSITEFWRRWHMSLGSWFRDYVYIPLGGNRGTKGKLFFNIFVVWFLTGFWHGAAWNFVVWGLYFGVFLVLEKFLIGEKLNAIPVVKFVYTFVVLAVSFVIFNATDMGEAVTFIQGMFGMTGVPFVTTHFMYYLQSYAAIIIVSSFGATPVPKLIVAKIEGTKMGENVLVVLRPIVLVALMLLVTAYLVNGSFNPFLYFRF